VLGAPFVAALEVIVYAGAIMILFVFVIMMLNIGPQSADQEGKWLASQVWVGPAILSVLLIAELVYVIAARSARPTAGLIVAPKQVGIALFGPYLLGVELASMVLLSGLVGAYHLGRRARAPLREPGELPEMAGRDGRGQETKRAQVAPAPQQAPRVKVH
jgi:NADH-quinone oxidoreductase subunit J